MKTRFTLGALFVLTATTAFADCPQLEGVYLCSEQGVSGFIEITQTVSESTTTYSINNVSYRADEQIYDLPALAVQDGLIFRESQSAKCQANRVEMAVTKSWEDEYVNTKIASMTRTTWRLAEDGDLLITSHFNILDSAHLEPVEGKHELKCKQTKPL